MNLNSATKCEIINKIKPYVKCTIGSLWAKDRDILVRFYKKFIERGVLNERKHEEAQMKLEKL